MEPSTRTDALAAARSLPPDFLWGTVTSAYQYEGAVNEDGRTKSIWDTFAHSPGHIVRGDTGDISCDGYHLFLDDLDLMRDLGATAYRFSIAWPRVQPGGKGPINPKGVDYYRRLINGIHERGMVALPTLYHWDLPQELEDVGGWRSRETSLRFAEYAGLTAQALDGLVTKWTTLNEPRCAAWLGYRRGLHAPGGTITQDALAAAHHLLLGHGLGVQAIRASSTGAEVGIVVDLNPASPATDAEADVAAAQRVDGVTNRFFLDALVHGKYPDDILEWFREPADLDFVGPDDLETINQPLDFLGVNFYFRTEVVDVSDDPMRESADYGYVGAQSVVKPGTRVSGQGWPVVPEALTYMLLRLRNDYVGQLPIYITETGTALDDYVDPSGCVKDVERIDFIADHINAIAAAVAGGANVKSLIIWSLLDNLEWHQGYARRFGLYFTDYPTQERIPKDSAIWFRDLLTSIRRP